MVFLHFLSNLFNELNRRTASMRRQDRRPRMCSGTLGHENISSAISKLREKSFATNLFFEVARQQRFIALHLPGD